MGQGRTSIAADRGTCRVVAMARGDRPREVLHERFSRYRRESAQGVEIGSSKEGAAWGLAPEALVPAALVSLDSAARWLERVKATVGAEASLVLTQVSRAGRFADLAWGAGPLMLSSVWSLALDVPLSGGRPPLRLMWSGSSHRGPGGEHDGLEDLRTLARGVDGARPTEAYAGPVVLGPLAAATVVHECIGHLAEADTPSTTLPLGTRLASELLDVVDDPMMPLGVARYEHDAANTRYLGPTTLVRSGRLVAHLHAPETAAAFGTLPTPNARAASADAPPIARMSNLCVRPGDADEEEMLDALGHGLYVHRLKNGLNNGRSVEAEIVLAEHVQAGALRGDRVSGGWLRLELTALRRVVAVGRCCRVHPNALCGRAGQLLFDVGTSAPALHLARVEIDP